jgi:hypothetical protein
LKELQRRERGERPAAAEGSMMAKLDPAQAAGALGPAVQAPPALMS